MLDDLKYIHGKDRSDALGGVERRFGTHAFMIRSMETWRAEVPIVRNPAKQLAHELLGKSVAIYAGPKLYAAAEVWKVACNKNARQLAWRGLATSDADVLGWTEQPREKLYAVVELRSKLEDAKAQKYFEVSERLLSGRRPAPIAVAVQGRTLTEQRLWATAFGEFVTIYLGLLNGVDPSSTPLLEKFKKELDK